MSRIPAQSHGEVRSNLDSSLDFHNDILTQSKRLVCIQMGRLPEDMRQLFLNELAGIVSGKAEADPQPGVASNSGKER